MNCRTFRYRQTTNAPRMPSSRVPTPGCDREKTASRKKDTRIHTTYTRWKGGPYQEIIPNQPMLAVSLTVGHACLTG